MFFLFFLYRNVLFLCFEVFNLTDNSLKKKENSSFTHPHVVSNLYDFEQTCNRCVSFIVWTKTFFNISCCVFRMRKKVLVSK